MDAGYHPMREFKGNVLCIRFIPKNLVKDKKKLKKDISAQCFLAMQKITTFSSDPET